MVEQETPKKQSGNHVQDEAGKSCLYVKTEDSSLPQSAVESLLSIGLSIIECADSSTAKKLCEKKAYGLIILEQCEDKDFFKHIKATGSLNEQTPIVLLFSDSLSDTVKELVKDQFIDDVILKCSTFDTDLTKAIMRLISEPLHFAVTPKAKKKDDAMKTEGSSQKRQKLDKTPLSACKRSLEMPENDNKAAEKAPTQQDWQSTAAPIQPMMMPFPSECASTYTNIDVCPSSAVYSLAPQQYVPGQVTFANGQPWISGQQQYQYFTDFLPEYNPPPPQSNSMGMLTAAMEMSLAVEKIPNSNATCSLEGSPSSQGVSGIIPLHDGRGCAGLGEVSELPAVSQTSDSNNETTEGDKTNSHPNNQETMLPNFETLKPLQSNLQVTETSSQGFQAEGMIPKMIMNGARQLLDTALQGSDYSQRLIPLDPQVTAVIASSLTPFVFGRDLGEKEKTTTPRSTKRKRDSINSAVNHSTSKTPSTPAERKEAHLEKERKRRERIARSWFLLRSMIPSCSDTADKATVFEMTVAYIHHCWKHHSDLIKKINKDFQQLCNVTTPPEDMDTIEEMVKAVLRREKA
ncbi:uncharacterized protein LOC5520925 [Nematostella vectensis]|uniref:uncharacterized protein LOC5520925 n=1 Tax=Nematostella vectensis TaxID=45351 RepID=UPI002076F5E8|nr:uncharacterized protein LOC5520925 [Nematostella vectensis]